MEQPGVPGGSLQAMRQVSVRCYGSLNDFLAPPLRGVTFERAIQGRPAARDFIESLGIPHPEVDLLLIEGAAGDLERPLDAGVRVAAYPRLVSLPLPADQRAGPPLPEAVRFIADVGLGRLATYLRMLGFDTVWHNDADDAWLAQVSAAEERILLSRDIGLLKRRIVKHGYFPRHTDPEAQLIEVVQRFDLAQTMTPFTRCLTCNVTLAPASLQDVRTRVPPRVASTFSAFNECRQCERVFWAGTHHERMNALVERLRRI